MGRKRRVAYVDSPLGLPVPLDYPRPTGSGELLLDKRRRINQPFDEQSSACHNMAAPLDHPAASTSRTDVRSVYRRPLKGRCVQSDDSSDDEDAMEENEPGVGAGIFGQASYQRSRAGVVS